MMDYWDLNVEIFRNPAGGAVMFQPRLDMWISEKKKDGTIPERYRDLDPLQIHDDLSCSIRPYKMFNPCLAKYVNGVRAWRYNIDIEERVIEQGGANRQVITRYKTPHGELEKVQTYNAQAHSISQWPVRHPDDLKALEYIFQEQIFEFDLEHYHREEARLGRRGAPQLFMARVNVMRLMIDWMGMETFMMALMTEPEKVERLIAVMDRKEEEELAALAASPIPIVNYGDNIDSYLCPVPYIRQYIAPQYARRTEVLHGAGKFVHAHFDGSLKPLLPIFKELAIDGIEALTPLPQGDVTLEELREAVPEHFVVIDVIPMVHFLPHNPVEELDATVERIIELFAPKLILGVSDEISPVCDIERVRRVAAKVNGMRRAVRR